MKLEFTAGGIIYSCKNNKFQLVLIKDSYDKWTFPKGHIEKHEKPEAAAIREISEEIGVEDLTIIKTLDKIDYWFKLNNQTYHKYVYYFLIEAPWKTKLMPQLSEINDARWFSPQDALNKLDYKKDSLKLLESAFKELKIVVK